MVKHALLHFALRQLLVAATAAQLLQLSTVLVDKGGWYTPRSGTLKGVQMYMVPALAVIVGLDKHLWWLAKGSGVQHQRMLSNRPISGTARKLQDERRKTDTADASSMGDAATVVVGLFGRTVPGLGSHTLQCKPDREEPAFAKRTSIRALENDVQEMIDRQAQLLEIGAVTILGLPSKENGAVNVHSLCFFRSQDNTPRDVLLAHVNTTLQAVVDKWRGEDQAAGAPAVAAAAGPADMLDEPAPAPLQSQVPAGSSGMAASSAGGQRTAHGAGAAAAGAAGAAAAACEAQAASRLEGEGKGRLRSANLRSAAGKQTSSSVGGSSSRPCQTQGDQQDMLVQDKVLLPEGTASGVFIKVGSTAPAPGRKARGAAASGPLRNVSQEAAQRGRSASEPAAAGATTDAAPAPPMETLPHISTAATGATDQQVAGLLATNDRTTSAQHGQGDGLGLVGRNTVEGAVARMSEARADDVTSSMGAQHNPVPASQSCPCSRPVGECRGAALATAVTAPTTAAAPPPAPPSRPPAPAPPRPLPRPSPGDVQGVRLQQMMGCTLSPPTEWPKWKHASSKQGAFGRVTFRWTVLDGEPTLVAVKTIGDLSKEEMQRLHRNAVQEWVQLNCPGLVQVHGSYLERDRHGHPHRLHIVMEPLVGRWVELSQVFYNACTAANISVEVPGSTSHVNWVALGVPGELLKELWDAGLGILVQLEGLGRYTRDLKLEYIMVDILAVADKYGDEAVNPELLEKHKELHMKLLRDIKAAQDAARADRGEEGMPLSSTAAAGTTAMAATVVRTAGVRLSSSGGLLCAVDLDGWSSDDLTLGHTCGGTRENRPTEAQEAVRKATSLSGQLKGAAQAAKSGKAQLYTFAMCFLRLLYNLPFNEPLVRLAQPEARAVLLPAINAPTELQEVLLGCLEPDPAIRLDLAAVRTLPFSQKGYKGMVGWKRPEKLKPAVNLKYDN